MGPRAYLGSPIKVFIPNDSGNSTVPVAATSEAWFYGRLLSGIVVLNPVRAMEVCLLGVLCVVT